MIYDTVHPSDMLIHGTRQYCDTCYSDAAKAGRLVRKTEHGDLCRLCERRTREGLVHYRPSNGTEGMMFQSQCERCRHHTDDGEKLPKFDVPGRLCAWAVLDRVVAQMFEGYDSPACWFQPEDLMTRRDNGEYIFPARCRRFTDKGDAAGEHRDPPPPDCDGQLFFGELLTVPERTAAPREAVTP